MSERYSIGPSGTIRAPSAFPEFPHPREFDRKDLFNMRHVRSVFANAPWFDIHAYRDVELIERYVRADMLPGGIPVGALETPDWELHCVVPVSALAHGNGEAEKRALWAQMIYKRIRRTIGETPVSADLRLDTWAFRTEGEISLATSLLRLEVGGWEDLTGVTQEALTIEAPILRAEFRYLRKADFPFWRVNIRCESSVLNRLGYLVAHQMVEIDLLKPIARQARYVPITAHWHSIEVPRGCNVEMPPELTYLCSVLRANMRSGYWVAWTARVAAFVLWGVYDTYHLWYLPPTLRGYIRILDLSVPLRSRANYREMLELLEIIEHTDWVKVPEDQRKIGAPRNVDHSPGRHSAGGDFIWYDPWTKARLSCEAARSLRDTPREIPEGTQTALPRLTADAAQTMYNKRISALREAVEWSYKDVEQSCSSQDFKRILRVRKAFICRLYTAAALFCNFKVCLGHREQVVSYF